MFVIFFVVGGFLATGYWVVMWTWAMFVIFFVVCSLPHSVSKCRGLLVANIECKGDVFFGVVLLIIQ